MKRILYIIGAIIVVYFLLSLVSAEKPQVWNDIQMKMTRNEVFNILGKPTSQNTSSDSSAIWKQNSLIGAKTLKLKFDDTDRVTGIRYESASWPFTYLLKN